VPQEAQAPDDTHQRLLRLEAENDELRRRVDLLAEDVLAPKARVSLEDLPARGDLGPSASRVYASPEGLAIGGYGEMLFEDFDSDQDGGAPSGKTDQADFLRAVLYVGYKFDEHWVFNSELEVEHADEIFAEFAYLDYLHSPPFNVRAGLVLTPMGWVNEQHEPTTFLSAKRPQTETLILPSTWRENGLGVHGRAGDFQWRAYLMNGLNAAGFTSSGLRGGRQKGSTALAEDLALVGRLDWTGVDGLTLGVSAYQGDSAQDLGGLDVSTSIVDLHAQYEWRGWRLRALAAQAELDQVDELNGELGLSGNQSVGEELTGWYAEAGYDLMSLWNVESRQSLTPFVRWEEYDTQAEVPGGFSANPARDVQALTVGLAWQPIGPVVFKLDFTDFDNDAGTGVDQVSVALGYSF
jgi:hypothetical protein